MNDAEVLRLRMQSLFARGIVRQADVKSGLAKMQAEFFQGEVRRVEAPQGYGFAASPFPGSEVFAAFPSGDRSAGVALAQDDRAKRPKGMLEGEVMVYGAHANGGIGHWLKFTDVPKANTIIAKGRRIELRVGDKYLILDSEHGLVSSEAITIGPPPP